MRTGLFLTRLAAAGLGFLFWGATPALAHGVGYRAAAFPAVALEFFYSTGEPMSYREAKVFSPADPQFANQTGRTDAGGRFAFVPDAVGQWRVIVRDEEGHQASAEIEIAESALNGASQAQGTPLGLTGRDNPPEGQLDLFLRSALGVSLLFNIAAFVSLSRRGKRERGAA